MSEIKAVAIVPVKSTGYGQASDGSVLLRGTFRYPGWPRKAMNFGVVISEDGVSNGVNSDRVGGLIPMPTVIQSAAYGELGKPGRVVEVEDGDVVEIAGRFYRISDDSRYEYPSLDVV